MADLAGAKREIRERILMHRNALPAETRSELSSAICQSIERIPEYTASQSILFFMPFRGEVDITPLLNRALERGVRCALPRCAPERLLRFFAVNDLKCDVAPGTWGILEPNESLAECTCGDFSVILVPGVAFDRHGRRIGYGGGYYDRLLGGSAKGALKIAPAFSFQVLEDIPVSAHDMPVDIIATEESIIDCRHPGGVYYGEATY